MQIATIRIPPKTKAMSPMLNSPSRAWSARSGNRVRNVAPCHIGLAGRNVDGIPTTGIDPALVSVTRAFIPSPQSISSTPVRTKGDRTTRNTSHRIAQDSHSQIAGWSIHANWCAAVTKCTVFSECQRQVKRSKNSARPSQMLSPFLAIGCTRRLYRKTGLLPDHY